MWGRSDRPRATCTQVRAVAGATAKQAWTHAAIDQLTPELSAVARAL